MVALLEILAIFIIKKKMISNELKTVTRGKSLTSLLIAINLLDLLNFLHSLINNSNNKIQENKATTCKRNK